MAVTDSPALRLAPAFCFATWIWPTTPQLADQAIVAREDGHGGGMTLWLREDGCVEFTASAASDAVSVRCPIELRSREWYFVACSLDAEAGRAALYLDASRFEQPWYDERDSGADPVTEGP